VYWAPVLPKLGMKSKDKLKTGHKEKKEKGEET
jgi:hypothetical protein